MARFLIDPHRHSRYGSKVKQAFVITNLLDLRCEPKFSAERASQLFFGEPVYVGIVRKGYVRVIQPDGYAGWVDRRFLCEASNRAVAVYKKAAEFVVVKEKVKVINVDKRSSESPHFLFYGTRIRVASHRQGWATCLRMDGSKFLVTSNGLVPVPKHPEASGADIVREARRFLGVPYLWGGISPAGFDCSGIVRTVLSRFGIYVPRDTKDQIKVGKPVERETVRTGDLLFFKRHVGFALGRDKIIHASMGGSGVRINSLRPGTDDYRPDLDRDFATARRIL